VGFSALLLLLFWRPWRWKTRRPDAITILRYGLTWA
jgi:inner membrane transporter RhtA